MNQAENTVTPADLLKALRRELDYHAGSGGDGRGGTYR